MRAGRSKRLSANHFLPAGSPGRFARVPQDPISRNRGASRVFVKVAIRAFPGFQPTGFYNFVTVCVLYRIEQVMILSLCHGRCLPVRNREHENLASVVFVRTPVVHLEGGVDVPVSPFQAGGQLAASPFDSYRRIAEF
jgi:hypothetical protein